MNTIIENQFNTTLVIFLEKIGIENINRNICTINYGNGLEFKFFNLSNDDLKKYQITLEELIRFNIFIVVSKITDYFTQTNIKLSFDVPNRNESILKDFDSANTHSIYINMYQDNKYFDCAFDFVKKEPLNNINTVNTNDNYKYISSLVNLDYYKYFDESIDKINIFMEDVIFRLLIILCSLNDDEFKLAEILFIKSNENLPDIQQQLEIYNKIICAKKNKFINLNDFYHGIIPVNPDTGIDMEFEDFINYIQENICDVQLDVTRYLIPWDSFEMIILNLDKHISKNIITYKKIYSQAINTLFLSLKTINELVQQINKTKKYIPQYITQLLSTDIVNFSNKELLNDIYEELSKYLDK